MAARLDRVTFDTADIEKVGSFYAGLTGWDVVRTEPDRIALRLPDGPEIAFQRAPDHVPPQWPGQDRPQQFHLDLLVDGHEAAAERAVALGATRLADGADWVTLADPAGHPIDLCQKDGVGPVMTLWAVAIDAPDASVLGHFYADLLGVQVGYDGPAGTLVSESGRSVMFMPVERYNPPRWPDPAHPQQAHLDIAVDDLDAGEQHALRLGAARLDAARLGAALLDAAAERFRVLADPAGHPFCLISERS